MLLKHVLLQNLRNYRKSEFIFDKNRTLIVGPNATGKTNIVEAISFLATGKSFRTEKDQELISFGQNFARIKGLVNDLELEVVVSNFKRYLVNSVGKRKVDFLGNLSAVLFSPIDLEIVVDSPKARRAFLDSVLLQTDRDYRIANQEYTKALRQRNALLEKARENGIRGHKDFEYWDNLLIENGGIITKKREALATFINNAKKEIFDFSVFYDKSVINQARLSEYREAERGAGVTLVGPHRDDMIFKIKNQKSKIKNDKELKSFGSRGEQRLTILQLKLIELDFIQSKIGERPVLLLDDIFSELDSEHIKHVLNFLDKQQTIITTTHREFIPKSLLGEIQTIDLSEEK